MLITVYQTDTEHRAVSLYNESNAQNKFTFKYWSCHAFNVVHQLSGFSPFCFAIFADEVLLLILSCKHFPEITHQYILIAPFFLHLKHFETSALLCVVKGILLDIGLNLRYFPAFQISNFPLAKKSCLLRETIFVEEFYTFTKRGTKAHYFCFLLLIQSSAVQQKSNKAALPNTKTFSPVKLALCVQSLCLLLHNNFLVFNISDSCWKSSRNLWTLPNHKSRVTRRGHRGDAGDASPPPDLKMHWHDTWFYWKSSPKIFLYCTLLNRERY